MNKANGTASFCGFAAKHAMWARLLSEQSELSCSNQGYATHYHAANTRQVLLPIRIDYVAGNIVLNFNHVCLAIDRFVPTKKQSQKGHRHACIIGTLVTHFHVHGCTPKRDG
jgi:hypothetical protein